MIWCLCFVFFFVVVVVFFFFSSRRRHTRSLCDWSSDGVLFRSSPVLLFFVTTSPCQEWVICAPAAFLGCGSRFSCSLSGIEPWFPVTRYNHGRHITYRRKLIGQTFERYVAGSRPCDQLKVIQSHQRNGVAPDWFWSNKSALSRRSELACMY